MHPLPESEWPEEVRAMAGTPTDPGRGRVLNIFATLGRHPKLMKRWVVFGNHVLGKSTLPPRERELVILRIGWRCGSEYEWGQHVNVGRACGLTDAEITAIAAGPDDASWGDDDRWLLRAVDDLADHHRITDAVWAALAPRWSEQQLLDLVFAVGQYQLVSCALNTLGVERDDGVEGVPFPEPPTG
jgi:alkylhydroperoxidase family enzyme